MTSLNLSIDEMKALATKAQSKFDPGALVEFREYFTPENVLLLLDWLEEALRDRTEFEVDADKLSMILAEAQRWHDYNAPFMPEIPEQELYKILSKADVRFFRQKLDEENPV